MLKREAVDILGIPLDRKPLNVLIDEAELAINRDGKFIVFACANPHSLVVAQNDKEFMHALCNANQMVADGVGITMMAKYAGIPIGPRITGHDYFRGILESLAARPAGGRVFFFGSSRYVLNKIAKRFGREYPQLELCGVLSPPYGEWSEQENNELLAQISAARPDVLWVGMTAPKQEKWVQANRHKLNIPVIGSIGAVFDFYAGTNPRAPRIMCATGTEWLYRLAKEPRRMWRRNFVSTPLFIGMIFNRHVLDSGQLTPAALRHGFRPAHESRVGMKMPVNMDVLAG